MILIKKWKILKIYLQLNKHSILVYGILRLLDKLLKLNLRFLIKNIQKGCKKQNC